MIAKDAPHSKESEMMVLGCMLSDNKNLNIAIGSLKDVDFYCTKHQTIFGAINALNLSGKPADTHLIAEELKRQNKLDSAGGLSYLMDLAQYAGTSAYVEEYIKDLRMLSQLRQGIEWAERFQRDALNQPKNVPTFFSKATDDFRQISEAALFFNEGSSVSEILSGKKSKISSDSLVAEIEKRKAYVDETGQPYINGLPMGFDGLDKLATILIATNLVIIGARPATGKTAFATCIGLNVASSPLKPYPVGIVSLEMGADQLVERLLSMKSFISGEKIQRGILTNDEMDKLREAEQLLREKKIYLYDENCHTVEQVVALARRARENHGMGLLIVDYLQLLSSSASRDGRQYEVADISRKLKLLAIELKIPVICLSQLSRKVEERQDHRPMMSDLRDSGQVEQDADVVIFLYRRDYYDPHDKPGLVELIVAKNRHGPVGTVKMQFDKGCGVFTDWINQATPKDLFGQ